MAEPRRLILVTGANGFIGSHLTEALLARGYRVRCLVRSTSDLKYIHGLPVEFARADLRDAADLSAACEGLDGVCHCAALTRALDEATFMQVNTRGTEALAQACLASAPALERFVFVSSLAAAGPSQGPDDFLDETRTPHPITWYGKSKLAAEAALHALEPGLRLSIVRPAVVYGPRDRDLFAYFALVKRGLNLQLGTSDRLQSLIYVADLVRLIILALEAEQAVGQTYFGCGSVTSRMEIAEAIARALGKRTLRVTLPLSILGPVAFLARIQGRLTARPALLNDQRILDLRQPYWLCSGEKARAELGFVPAYDLEAGVRAAAAWYTENRWL